MPDALLAERASDNQQVDEGTKMERRSSLEVMEELLPLRGATIVDVGCGDGWLTRVLTRRGAHVTGIEVSPRHLQGARTTPPVGDEHYIQGVAEDLPIVSRSVDIVLFFNSLHHIDKDGLAKALSESARVLKSGGILYVSEPLPEGPYFEVMKPVHDETEVRQQAQAILRTAPEYGLLVERTVHHVDKVKLRDFEAFHDRLTSINPHVREQFDELEDAIRDSFHSLGRQVEDGWEFEQPMRACLLRRS
jgi:Methylase involved in ubiquinone/menaquinone biosynthesis